MKTLPCGLVQGGFLEMNNNFMKNRDISIRKMILIDGLGALLSAFLLGVVLVNFQSYFGIPKPSLYFLAALPCFFAIYDFICYLKLDKNLGVFLKVIAVLNVLYCILSLGVAFSHRSVITGLGWAYVIGEIIVVTGIAVVEFRVANGNLEI